MAIVVNDAAVPIIVRLERTQGFSASCAILLKELAKVSGRLDLQGDLGEREAVLQLGRCFVIRG